MEFLLKLSSNILRDFKSGLIRTITTKSTVNWKKEFLHMCISKILFIDTEKLSKMQISSQVLFKDFDNYNKNNLFKGTLKNNIENHWKPSVLIFLIIIWKFIYTNIQTYKHTYIHTYIHTCIHTCFHAFYPWTYEKPMLFYFTIHVYLNWSRWFFEVTRRRYK